MGIQCTRFSVNTARKSTSAQLRNSKQVRPLICINTKMSVLVCRKICQRNMKNAYIFKMSTKAHLPTLRYFVSAYIFFTNIVGCVFILERKQVKTFQNRDVIHSIEVEQIYRNVILQKETNCFKVKEKSTT